MREFTPEEKELIVNTPITKVYLADLKKAFEAGQNEIKKAETDINQSYKEFRRQVRCKWH